MTQHDHIGRPRGTFTLETYRRGMLVDRWVDRNLVVDKAKLCMSRLIAGNVANRSITQIAFGISGAAPAPGNTVITGAFTKAIGAPTYPDDASVLFPFTLDATEANGLAIFEFGLLAADGTLFARKVRSAALAKDSDISLAGSWLIEFPF